MVKKLITVLTVAAMLVSVAALGFGGLAAYEETVLFGDANSDGKLDTEDARLVLQAASGIVSITDGDAFDRADVNSDGALTIFDARQILRATAGLISLQPSGAFSGIECEGGIRIDEQTAVLLFNQTLNRVKTEKDGFAAAIIKTEDEELNKDSLQSSGSVTGPVMSLISSIVAGQDDEQVVTHINKGSQNYSAMSIEGSPYVSLLEVEDIYGMKASYDIETGYITLKIAIPDAELESLSQSSYAAVLNTEIMLEETNNLLVNFLDASQMRRYFKNGVLTLVVDNNSANGDVISYGIDYESEMFVSKVTVSFLGREYTANNLTFTKTHSINYEFDWTGA